MARKQEDRYSNVAAAVVTETAAGTLTFTELLTGISLGQGTGLLIDQFDYYPNGATLELLVATGDRFLMGWTVNNTVSSLEPTTSGVIHSMRMSVEPVIGTPASGGHPILMPVSFQFFPSMIVASPRLYLGVQSNSLTSAAAGRARIYFRYIDLTSQEYLELAEAFVLVG